MHAVFTSLLSVPLMIDTTKLLLATAVLTATTCTYVLSISINLNTLFPADIIHILSNCIKHFNLNQYVSNLNHDLTC